MTLSTPEIIKKLEGIDQEARNLKKKLYELCWYMRGGLSIAEIMQIAVSDISIIDELVNEHLDTTKKTGMAFF